MSWLKTFSGEQMPYETTPATPTFGLPAIMQRPGASGGRAQPSRGRVPKAPPALNQMMPFLSWFQPDAAPQPSAQPTTQPMGRPSMVGRPSFGVPVKTQNNGDLANLLLSQQIDTARAPSLTSPMPNANVFAPIMGAQINPALQAQVRDQQGALVKAILDRASGAAPSAAELMLARGKDKNAAAVRSQVASIPGISQGMRARLAATGVASANAESDSQLGVLRAQEQTAAEQSAAQLLGGIRGQDLGLALEQAGLTQNAALASGQLGAQGAALDAEVNRQNIAAILAQREQGMNQYRFLSGLGLDRDRLALEEDKLQLGADLSREQMIMSALLAGKQLNAQMEMAELQRKQQELAAILGFTGNIAGGAMGIGAAYLGSGGFGGGAGTSAANSGYNAAASPGGGSTPTYDPWQSTYNI